MGRASSTLTGLPPASASHHLVMPTDLHSTPVISNFDFCSSLQHPLKFTPGPCPPPRPNTDSRSNVISSSFDSVPVTCLLYPPAWESFLADYPDRPFVHFILHIIRFGANVGFAGTRCSQSCENLRSALDHLPVVENLPGFVGHSRIPRSLRNRPLPRWRP